MDGSFDGLGEPLIEDFDGVFAEVVHVDTNCSTVADDLLEVTQGVVIDSCLLLRLFIIVYESRSERFTVLPSLSFTAPLALSCFATSASVFSISLSLFFVASSSCVG